MRAPARGGLVRDTIVYAGGIGLQRGLAILVLPAATRALDRGEVGVAGAALAVSGFLSIVLALGFSFAVVRLYYDEPAANGDRAAWAMLLRVQLVVATALAGVAWATGPWWSRMFADVPWGGALQAAVILALAQAAQSSALGILRASRRVGAFAGVVLVHVVVGGTGAVLLAERDGAAGMVTGLALGSLAAALVGLAVTRRPAAWSWPALRTGLALSLPFVAHMLAAWVMSLSDRVLVERFLGLEDLASYHVAYALASLPVLATDAAQQAWVPHFYGLSDEARRTLPSRLARPATLAVIPIAAGVVLVAPALARVLAPADFDVPMAVVALVTSTTFVRASYLLGFAALSDVKDSRSIARGSSVAAALNVAVNLVAIPAWGLNGAAASTLLAYAAMSILLLTRVRQKLDTPIPVGSLLPAWAGGAGLMLVLAAIPTSATGWLVRGALLAAAAAVSLVGVSAVRAAARGAGATTSESRRTNS